MFATYASLFGPTLAFLGFWSMAVKQFQLVILAFLLRIALGRVRKEK
jgi:hypothetical protein